MNSTFGFTTGNSESIPRKLFLPKHFVFRNGVNDSMTMHTSKDGNQVPLYTPAYNFDEYKRNNNMALNVRFIDDGRLAVFYFNQQEDALFEIYSWQNNKPQLEGSWTLDSPYIYEQYASILKMITTFSLNIDFCTMVKYFYRRFPDGRPKLSKFRISIVDFLPPLPTSTIVEEDNNNMKGISKIHKDVFMLDVEEDIRYFVVGLSANSNTLALGVHFDIDKRSRVYLLKINFNEISNEYSMQQTNVIHLHNNVNRIMFGQQEDKILCLEGSRFFLVEDKSPANYEAFGGSNARLFYNAWLEENCLLLRRSDHVELLKITGNRKMKDGEFNKWGMGKLTFKVENSWDFAEDLEKTFGLLRTYEAHVYLNRMYMFLGFQKQILVVEAITYKEICSISLEEFESPFQYAFHVNWSGEQIVAIFRRGMEIIGIKIYHMEPRLNFSLKEQSTRVIAESFSIKQLREMKIPKYFRKLLGDVSKV